MYLELKEDKVWRKQNCQISRDTFLRDSKTRNFRDKLVLQKPMETLQDILEFDNNFYRIIRRRQFLTFSVLEVRYWIKKMRKL